MTSWAKNLKKVKTGKATKVEFVDAITHWMGTEVAASTEGMGEAVSRRAVWLFPDGYALAVGANFDPVFYHLSKELPVGSMIPLPQSRKKNWLFASRINGWTYSGVGGRFPKAAETLALVDLFSANHGEPKLLLPWAFHWVESITEQGEDYYDWDESEDGVNKRKIMSSLATAIEDGSVAEACPWEFLLGSEEDGISHHSDFSKFQRFIEKVEEAKIAILDLDQHCAACSNGTYEDAVASDPELAGKEVFLTWGQNSEGKWLGDGSVYMESGYIDNPEFERQLKQLAQDEGLDMGLDDKNWEPSGSFAFESK
jgi:hypothetical protein